MRDDLAVKSLPVGLMLRVTFALLLLALDLFFGHPKLLRV